MRTIEQIAPDARKIVQSAVKALGADLQGSSVIDLVLDNLEDRISTADAKAVLVISGVDSLLSHRLVRSYSLRNGV
jgi:hypothetical protein